MQWQDLLSDGYGQAHSSLKSVLQGLTPEDLDWQPKPDCNSIGWLAWHLVRQQDAAISYVMKDKQLWIADGWHDKFNRSADPLDYGTGQAMCVACIMARSGTSINNQSLPSVVL